MRFQVFLSLWGVKSGSCIDKIPEVAKTKVSKLKKYYNPKSEKVGTVWKTQIKKESSDF